ncbi:MAG: hypothetical protein UY32_C0009G0014 [Candidatus Jorgensenbacteria bacterium GW2011_GWC1_48_8]|uniref:Uncharacterized protein n=2 Tax=Candidatus Joergenseniibacteriota TaxID=1752739 RepID=A0A0G1W7Q6_9BACT|nr:MAG: hypothetical protein UY32_C0009G0014 [Candidatus Jorgensenbacteria bacterium GW2011_GWC1_48_8]KKW14610.1 MAG: hypothetical protein UY55_C0006G0019 [Candidatus Jorgensenbacteria bacterium GW2011_GWB1_50_10]
MEARNGFLAVREVAIGIIADGRKAVSQRGRWLAIYAATVVALSFLVGGWSRLTPLLLWTFANAETSYLGWSGTYKFHPLSGYLAVALTTATIHLTAMWFILFEGDEPFVDFGRFKRFFNFFNFNVERYPRFYAWIGKKKLRGLFCAGLCPEIWWVGFAYQRNDPQKFGALAVILGNMTKLTIWACLCYFAANAAFWKWVVIPTVIVFVVFFPSRLVERLLPGNGAKRSLRSLR